MDLWSTIVGISIKL